MEKSTKLQETELQRLQKFQSDSLTLINSLGQLAIQKNRILKDDEFLNKQIDILNEEEISISTFIKKLYGNVDIDLKTGEFTYSKE
jgi:hypothetical protein|tara:strand:+ start:3605 stop:3862 length:258 start_codon:yes stop_codon:yes gene_type:complete